MLFRSGCKIAEPEGLSEVRQILKDVGKIGDNLTYNDQVSLSWRDKGDHIEAHIIADYAESNGERTQIDAIEVVKLNERSTIYLDGAPHIRILLKIEPSKG